MKNLVIIVLVLVLGWLFFSRPTHLETVITEVDTVYKTDTFKTVKKGKDIPYKVIDSIFLIDEVHDTAYIVKDYAEVKAYSDTIYKDSNKFVINDTITRNKIHSRGFEAYLTEKTIIRNNYIFTKDKNALYLGIIGGMRTIGVGAMYSTKKSTFILSYDNQIKLGYFKKIN